MGIEKWKIYIPEEKNTRLKIYIPEIGQSEAVNFKQKQRRWWRQQLWQQHKQCQQQDHLGFPYLQQRNIMYLYNKNSSCP